MYVTVIVIMSIWPVEDEEANRIFRGLKLAMLFHKNHKMDNNLMMMLLEQYV